mmetsp:Transcript_29551/g.96573  ORF Transcript_29551/g.96573 Transcript_29551/m.96573 type:complete len:277 (-) Transcript_29551:694-1524(-)
MPVSLPSSSGMTLPTALAAPVEAGMMLKQALRPPLQSLSDTESSVGCVAVTACTVVMRPFSMPNSSLTILANGARQLVVQLALEMTLISGVYLPSLTPMTNMGAVLEGALMMTRFAPPLRWPLACSSSVNRPEHSRTTSTPASPHGMAAGSLSFSVGIRSPSMMSESPSLLTSTSAGPCVESYLNMYAMYSGSRPGLLMAATLTAGLSMAARRAILPMRPKPLIPMAHGPTADAPRSKELMICTNSGLREAPPTRNPSTSGRPASDSQLLAVTEPP